MQNDVTYIAIIIGLFVLMFLLVAACDRIIGSDEAVLEDQGGDTGPDATAGAEDGAVAA